MLVQEPVQAAIWNCLNHYFYQDAIFLAERLRAEVESDETAFLLATCYYRSGKAAQAYAILQDKGASSPQCKFLMAKCCVDLQKTSEAEAILTGDITRCKNLDEIVQEFGDSACFVLALLARVCCVGERKSRGLEAYKRSLRLNPFLWHSFEELCRRGDKPDPVKTFSSNNVDSLTSVIGSNPIINYVNTYCNPSPVLEHSVNSTPVQMTNILNGNMVQSGIKPFTPDEKLISMPLAPAKPNRLRNVIAGPLSPITPSFGVLPLDSSSPNEMFLSPILSQPTLTESNDQKGLGKRTFLRKESPLQLSKVTVFNQSFNNTHCLTTPSVVQPPTAPLQPGQNVRRSSRLFTNSYSVKENNKSPNRNKFPTPKSPSRKTKTRSKGSIKVSFNELNERNRVVGVDRSETITLLATDGGMSNSNNVQTSAHSMSQQAVGWQKQSVDGLMSLLRDLGTAYLYLCQFNCKKAIECFNSLSDQQYNTGWVLCMVGKAYFELAEYQQSVKHFSLVRELEPYRSQLMELYSTALWQLQRESALSALAQELVTLDRNSPAAWCAAGNCFSLQKEHDTAIKFFHRAVQVDPTFAYAYTLLGHEYVVTEELEKAMSCFRSAVGIDSRHYNAWYGIGTIFSKQERFTQAEVYFRKALSINPHSSVLKCHIAVVQNALQKTDRALETLDIALLTDPKNPLCKFHRASIYFAAGRHPEALKELEELKEIVPKESLVYYLTGKVHKKLGNTHLALMHFSWATDLDPKGANSQIKEAIDPAISRSQSDDADDFPQNECSLPPAETSQEQPHLQMHDSDDSIIMHLRTGVAS
uniref:Cell division cycle protein 27 homolog n=1 Tax=Clastoptera arizonana TaxID=38151 RepID=A0A1B6CA75_9HEMI